MSHTCCCIHNPSPFAILCSLQKLQDRRRAFQGGSFATDKDKEKWSKILSMEFMSSDESGMDDGKDVLITKPLKWESEAVISFKRALDDQSFRQKSPLAKRQMKTRKRGLHSSRPKPLGDFPSWAFMDELD